MHSNEITNVKKAIKLNRRQRSIIVGTLLGDGHLETCDKGKTYRLKTEHSMEQKEYVDWLYKELKPLTRELPRARVRLQKLPQGTEIKAQSYGFTTYSLGALRFYGQQFYKGKVKIIPKLISKLLDPISLAVWYLDDVSWKSNHHRTFVIHTHGYPKNELQKILKALERFDIKASLHMQRRDFGIYWRIYILSESAGKFKKIIQPIIQSIPSMRYKLGNILPKK